MKKITVLLLILAFVLSFSGCGYSNVTYSYVAETLYDENGTAVQLWILDDPRYEAGFTYEIMQDADGSAYININSAHDHPTKMPVPEESVLQMDEHKSFGFDSFKKTEEWGDCLIPPVEGENTYQGQKIVNVYYLDKNAQSPVIVMTDMVNGIAKTILIKPTQTIDGQYFILSNGSGECYKISADGTADDILAALPEDVALVDMSSITILYFKRDDEGHLFGSSFNDVEYDIFVSENEQYYLIIPTVTGESIYVYFDHEDYDYMSESIFDDVTISNDVAIITPVTEYVAVLPSDIL